jgi:hypothetical protein
MAPYIVCVCVCMYVCMYICMYTHTLLYLYVHLHLCTLYMYPCLCQYPYEYGRIKFPTFSNQEEPWKRNTSNGPLMHLIQNGYISLEDITFVSFLHLDVPQKDNVQQS